MSLTSFIGMPDVKAKLKPLRPKRPRKIAAPLQVEPKSDHYSIVGTAFDYLLRFELQRQAPHAVTRPWIAEQAPDLIWKETEAGGSGIWIDWLDNSILADCRQKGLATRARGIVVKAKAAVTAYVKLRKPSRGQQADLAAHAIRLAKLDVVFRAHKLDPSFEVADLEDVEDLLALLAIVPFDALIHPKIMHLNPDFGKTSVLVGGADTDLITGDMLVDFKATKKSEMHPRDLDQLLGYYLPARQLRRLDPTFPQINRLALYFSRHGYLWVTNASSWTEDPRFPEVEEWFFKCAQEVFSRLEKV